MLQQLVLKSFIWARASLCRLLFSMLEVTKGMGISRCTR